MGFYDGYSCYTQKEQISWMPEDQIVFHINAHGYKMGQSPEYYVEFFKDF